MDFTFKLSSDEIDDIIKALEDYFYIMPDACPSNNSDSLLQLMCSYKYKIFDDFGHFAYCAVCPIKAFCAN